MATGMITSADIQKQYEDLVKATPHNYYERSSLLWEWVKLLIVEGKRDDAWDKSEEALYYSIRGEKSYVGFEVFSFRQFDDKGYSVGDIKNNTLSLVHPNMFNDPFDTMLFKWLEQRVNNSKDVANELACMMLRRGDAIKARCFMRSTPLEPTDGSVAQKEQRIEDVNPLMWAHYANSHKGFCAKYEITKEFTYEDDTKHTLLRVAKINYEERIDMESSINFEEALLKKSKIWEYENEVRAILYDPKCLDQVTTKPAPKLKAVYLGLRCSSSDRQKMAEALRGSHVPLFQMDFDTTDACRLIPRRIG